MVFLVDAGFCVSLAFFSCVRESLGLLDEGMIVLLVEYLVMILSFCSLLTIFMVLLVQLYIVFYCWERCVCMCRSVLELM